MPLADAPLQASLRASLADLFGAKAAVAVVPVATASAALFPEEAAAIARAVPARRAEFQAGRQAARAALLKAGAMPAAIPMRADRAPIWPTGFTGSISHSAGVAVAVAAASPPTRALGLDLEPDTPLEADLWRSILTTTERRWLDAQPENRRGVLAKRIFCIKECAYKAQYGLSRTLLEFSAFEVTLPPKAGPFRATFQHHCPPFSKGEVLHGRVAVENGLILAGIAL